MASNRSTVQRLCLVTPASVDPAAFAPLLAAALAAGDVASVIIAAEGTSPAASQRIAEQLVPLIQRAGAAALVRNDTRVAGRIGADGVHVDSGPADLGAAVRGLRPRLIVGAAGVASRHEAMTLGEAEPDYVFFGRLDGDDADRPEEGALALAAWWAPLFQIPAIVMAGGSLASTAEAAATGAEFVALGRAVWEHPDGPAAAVRQAGGLLAAARLPA